ncbi:peptidylprolyl isomerase [Dongia soli]|uniref:Parvulin-like PPIase n=1 Tax=Dongia soli TaxID=600628 RepID=A0ABU5ECC1_9PROT|nr:peptidylprolyl isomerase [Dongia soli]MDY0884023.1 peptidylprolyl isomerase [Dongia soli]
MMISKRFWRNALAALLIGCSIASIQPAAAQDELKIAAVVNDEIITQLDLVMRMRIAMVSAKLPNTPEVQQRLLPQVLRQLIDEHLKRQEAKKEKIEVSDEEVDREIDRIAQRNGLTREQLQEQLSSSGILLSAISDQIRADIGWVRVVQTKLRSSVNITEEEINDEIARIKATQGQSEYRLQEIFLAVDNPSQDSSVAASAQRLADQLNEGADFGSLAAQFSQDQSADQGGDQGWVRLDQMEPALTSLVQSTPPNQLIGPVRGIGGYYLAIVRAVRPAASAVESAGTVSLKRVLWSMPANAAESEISKANDQAREVASKIQSCDGVQSAAAGAATAVYSDLGTVSTTNLAPEIQAAAINQPIGVPTAPIRTGQGVGIYVICARQGGDQGLSRVAIADRLGRQRMETLARGYLSDLRRAAVVEVRM